MSKVTVEAAFESSIERVMIAEGWVQGSSAGYDVKLGLIPDDLVGFLAASQPDEWEQLCTRLGGEQSARAKVVKRVADELTARGTIDVLRGGVKDHGVSFRVAFFAPANNLTPGLW